MTTETNGTPAAAANNGANQLFDYVIGKLALKNDAALARALEVAPAVVSKIRHARLPVTARQMIKIHEISDLSIREIKIFLGLLNA